MWGGLHKIPVTVDLEHFLMGKHIHRRGGWHIPTPRLAVSLHLYSSSCAWHAKSLRLHPTLYDPIDCSLPGSSVHGILQARILEWVPCPPPGDLLDIGIETASLVSPELAGRFFSRLSWWLRWQKNLCVVLEKEMATHSSTLAWKIPWIEDPARLQSMGSQRVRHDRATSLSLSVWETWVQSQAWEDLWRREWQPIPVFLPGKSHG